MSDIVERLRDASYENAPSRCMEAAREIEKLQKQVEIALSALKHIRDISAAVGNAPDSTSQVPLQEGKTP